MDSADDLMTPGQVSGYTRAPTSTLRYWRHRGEGPAWFRLGRNVRYMRSDVEAWIAEQRAHTGRQAS